MTGLVKIFIFKVFFTLLLDEIKMSLGCVVAASADAAVVVGK